MAGKIRNGFELSKQSWGEGFVGSTTISGMGVVVLVLGFTTIALLTSVVNGIFQTSLYNFATTGDAGAFIDTELAGPRSLTPSKPPKIKCKAAPKK